MKKRLIFTFIIQLWISAVYAQRSMINEMIRTKQFFEVEKEIAKPTVNVSSTEKTIYKAVLLNAFGKAEHSNKLLLTIDLKNQSLSDTLTCLYYQTLYDNYVKLFDYSKAAETGHLLFTNYSNFYTQENLKEEIDAVKIWKWSTSVAPQTISQPSKELIHLKKDLAKLWNVPISKGDSTYNFVFDSGAGMSTITDTYAKKLGLTFVSDSTVGITSGLTGNITNARIGVAPLFKLGAIEIHNCLFLVFPDSALSFANGAYKINGIIGFPIIKELGTLHFTGSDLLITHETSSAKIVSNMTLDQLKPIIYLKYKNDLLPFTFDSGAQGSLFSDVFYRKYQTELDKTGTPLGFKIGGASGEKTLSALKIPEIKLQCGSSSISLSEAIVSKELLETNQDIYFGNIGQDVISQFKTMIIDFKKSYIEFQH